MNFYKTDDGVWVGTQAQAGNKNVIEIPCTSKPEMLEWLNENCSEKISSLPSEVPVQQQAKPENVWATKRKSLPDKSMFILEVDEILLNSDEEIVSHFADTLISRLLELKRGK
jgi:hypothetical protein